MGNYTLKSSSTWFDNSLGITRGSIVEIEMKTVNKFSDIISTKVWDASADGSVRAYVDDNNNNKLYIVREGTGKIVAAEDSSYIFSHKTSSLRFSNVVKISGLELLDTSKVTTLASAFADCKKLVELTDISKWDTKLVTNIDGIFQQNFLLVDASVGNWDMSNCTSAVGSFRLATSLKSLVLRWNTKKLTNIASIFSGHGKSMSLTSIDISSWDFTGISYAANEVFRDCTNLVEVKGIERLVCKGCTTIGSLLWNCSSLKELDTSLWDTSSCDSTLKVFEGMSSLEKIRLGKNFSFNNKGSITDNSKIGSLPGSSWYTLNKVEYPSSSTLHGKGITLYKSLDLVDSLERSLILEKTLSGIADSVRARTGATEELFPYKISEMLDPSLTINSTFLSEAYGDIVDHVEFVRNYTPTGEEMIVWDADLGKTGKIKGYITGSPPSRATIHLTTGDKIYLDANSTGLFANIPMLETVKGLELLDTSRVKFLDRAFSECQTLKTVGTTEQVENGGVGTVDLSSLDFPNLESFVRMFEGCASMENIKLWDGMTKVDDLMFHRCIHLHNIEGLKDVTEIGIRAFIYTPELVSLDFEVDPDHDATKIVSIGESACRLSNIEDIVSFNKISSVTVADGQEHPVGNQATRKKRWPTKLSSVQSVSFSQYCPNKVFLEVPNPDRQTNYPYYPFGRYGSDNRVLSVATGGCNTVKIYHEWNAVHQRHKNGTDVAPNFISWLEEFYVEKRKEKDPNFKLEDENISDRIDKVMSTLGWKKQDYIYMNDESDVIFVLERLNREFPLGVSMYSAHSVQNMHAAVLIGFQPAGKDLEHPERDNKFAIIDPNVVYHTGITTWHKFEDIFDQHLKTDPGVFPRNGMDSVWIVTDYNDDTINNALAGGTT